jgi:alpha-mannosidase
MRTLRILCVFVWSLFPRRARRDIAEPQRKMKMKKIFLFILIPFYLFAQTNVDKLVEKLNLLSEASFINWKYSTNLSLKPSDISQKNFDDSSWQNATLNQSFSIDSCWFRKEIEIPSFIAGVPVKGKLNFLATVDDYSYIWINGESKGKFGWDAEFLLTENAMPGDKFTVLIKAINTGGPLRLIQAKLNFEMQPPLQKLIKNLSLSFRVGQKLLSFDSYQSNERVKIDPGIDLSKIKKSEKEKLGKLLQELATKLNIDALKEGDTTKFIVSVNQIKKELKPISDFAKQFTLQFTANAHIDAAWLWRKKETEEVTKRTFSAVMNMFKARPDFTYTQSQAALYDWMKVDYPDLFEQMRSYADKGRWEISGGMWIEPDCNLPSGDSWARQLLYGQKFFKNNFGKQARIGWNPDSFGYNWNLPQFMLKGGLDAFITQKIGWNDTNVFPHRLFWWQSPDGSKILTYFPFSYVNEIENPFGLVDWLRQYEANTGLTKLLVLFGVGDHGGGPSLEMMARIDQLRELYIYPKIEFNTAQNYIDWVRKHDISKLPVWDDELYLEYHRGTATTQSNTKKWNRSNEVLLTNSEKFNSVSTIFGGQNNASKIKDAWKIVLFNQFHDILPGSSIREVYIDADKDYREANDLASFTLNKSLKNLTSQINTSVVKDGKAVIVFNPLSWVRTDVAKVELTKGDEANYLIYDLDGKEIPSQLQRKDKLTREIIFIAKDVPSLGYKTYVIKKTDSDLSWKQKDAIPPSNAPEGKIENEFFKVTIDGSNGLVKSILDKRLQKELLNGFGNKLQLLEDLPKAWDAWNIGLTGKEFPSTYRNFKFVENGPVKSIIRITRDYLKPGVVKSFPTEDYPNSFFTQDIILYKGIDRIDFKTDVEWWEEKTMLKVAFPFNVQDTVATYEIPFGTIKRSTTLKAQWDKGKWEVNAQKWADLSNDEFGISLINKSKYGYDTRENVMRLSLLRSPKWPDPTADRGDHAFEYSLFPHKGRLENSETVHKGYEFNYPLISVLSDIHNGELPINHSFVQISDKSIILTSIKQADEDENAFILTMYESSGKEKNVEFTLPFNPVKVFETDFLEETLFSVKHKENKINLTMPKNSVKVLKVFIKE